MKRLRRQALLRLTCGGVLLLTATVVFALYADSEIEKAAAGRIYTVTGAPACDVAVVFGARVFRDGSVSYPLHVRLEAARTLYEAGKIQKILVSGDNGRKSYNEPETMRNWLIDRGIPAEDISCDYAGFRTLDTCARARQVWNLESVALITQHYHVPRAVYLGRNWDLDCIGISADPPNRQTATRRDRLRETLARTLAWLDVNLLDRQPRFFGPPETI